MNWRTIVFGLAALAAVFYLYRRYRYTEGFYRLFRLGLSPLDSDEENTTQEVEMMLPTLSVEFGRGAYVQDGRRISGEIIVDKTKLYLRDSSGELSQTFVSLDELWGVQMSQAGLVLQVGRNAASYQALLEAPAQSLKELASELVRRRGLRKVMLKDEWLDPEMA